MTTQQPDSITVPVQIDLRKLFVATEKIEKILIETIRAESGSYETTDLLSMVQAVCGAMTARYGVIFPAGYAPSFNVAISINELVHNMQSKHEAAQCN